MEERLIHQDDKRQYQCTLLVSMLVVMCFGQTVARQIITSSSAWLF